MAHHLASLPPVSTLFASFLGYNPIGSLLRPTGVLHHLTKAQAAQLTSKEYFPHLISGPFHHGLVIVFSVAIAMSILGAFASLLRGGQFYYDAPPADARRRSPGRRGLIRPGSCGAKASGSTQRHRHGQAEGVSSSPAQTPAIR